PRRTRQWRRCSRGTAQGRSEHRCRDDQRSWSRVLLGGGNLVAADPGTELGKLGRVGRVVIDLETGQLVGPLLPCPDGGVVGAGVPQGRERVEVIPSGGAAQGKDRHAVTARSRSRMISAASTPRVSARLNRSPVVAPSGEAIARPRFAASMWESAIPSTDLPPRRIVTSTRSSNTSTSACPPS